MAIGDGLNNANKQAQELKNNISATDKALKDATATSAQLTEEARSLTEELKDQLNIKSSQNEGEKTLLSLSRQITQSAQENKVALGQQGDITKQIKKETNQLLAAQREQLILEKSLTDEQVTQAQKIVDKNNERLNTLSHIDRLQQQLSAATESEKSGIMSQIRGYQDRLAANEASLDAVLGTADAETQRLALSIQLANKAKENVKESQKEEAIQKKISKALGITGNILDGIKKNFSGFATAIGIDEVANEMKRVAEEAARSGKEISRMAVLGAGLKTAFSNLGNFLTNPEVIFTNLMKGFNAVDKAATSFARQTGQDMNTLSTSIDSANMHYITMAEYITTASELTKELGQNANAIFQPEDIIEASEMVHAMGMSVKESNQLAKLSKINGGNIKEQNKALVEGVNSYNKQNKTAYASGEILKDVANVSDAIAISYAGYPERLAEAATAAKDLGMSLGDVDKIAD